MIKCENSYTDKTRITAEIVDSRVLAILEPNKPPISSNQEESVRLALENPIDSPRLQDLVAGKRNILVITSDHTRPAPSKITMPLFLQEIREKSRCKNKDVRIEILIATELHRAMTSAEMTDKFGTAAMATVIPDGVGVIL